MPRSKDYHWISDKKETGRGAFRQGSVSSLQPGWSLWAGTNKKEGEAQPPPSCCRGQQPLWIFFFFNTALIFLLLITTTPHFNIEVCRALSYLSLFPFQNDTQNQVESIVFLSHRWGEQVLGLPSSFSNIQNMQILWILSPCVCVCVYTYMCTYRCSVLGHSLQTTRLLDFSELTFLPGHYKRVWWMLWLTENLGNLWS